MIQKLSNTKTPCRAPDGFQLQHRAEPQKDLPSTDLQLRVIDCWEDLTELIPAWERLAETSIEPNVFYEPHFLLPAMEHLMDKQVRVVVLEAPVRVCQDDRRVLCGLFPIQKRRSIRGIPFSTLEMWEHEFCFLTTPLVRRDVAGAVIETFLEWQQNQRQRVMHIPQLSAGGPVDRLLTETLHRCGTMRMVRDSHVRATIVRRESAMQVLQQGLSRKRRHELNRNRRKLQEQGQINFEIFDDSQNLVAWLEQFMALEATGWKGKNQSAIQHNLVERNFFESMIHRAAKANKLTMIRLQMDGKTIAMKINLLSGQGAFCFKIAYDEDFARYSPGVLLEVENLDWLHEDAHVTEWMDSCAQPGHTMIENVWPDRRKIESVVIPSGRRFASVSAASLPIFRAIKKSVSRRLSKLFT